MVTDLVVWQPLAYPVRVLTWELDQVTPCPWLSYIKNKLIPNSTADDDFVNGWNVDVHVVVYPKHEPWRFPISVEGRPVQAQEVLESQE
jgi:hypothetical protein